jgi:hypothetical protein
MDKPPAEFVALRRAFKTEPSTDEALDDMVRNLKHSEQLRLRVVADWLRSPERGDVGGIWFARRHLYRLPGEEATSARSEKGEGDTDGRHTVEVPREFGVLTVMKPEPKREATLLNSDVRKIFTDRMGSDRHSE